MSELWTTTMSAPRSAGRAELAGWVTAAVLSDAASKIGSTNYIKSLDRINANRPAASQHPEDHQPGIVPLGAVAARRISGITRLANSSTDCIAAANGMSPNTIWPTR